MADQSKVKRDKGGKFLPGHRPPNSTNHIQAQQTRRARKLVLQEGPEAVKRIVKRARDGDKECDILLAKETLDYGKRYNPKTIDITGKTMAQVAQEVVALQMAGELDMHAADRMLANLERAMQITEVEDLRKRIEALEEKR